MKFRIKIKTDITSNTPDSSNKRYSKLDANDIYAQFSTYLDSLPQDSWYIQVNNAEGWVEVFFDDVLITLSQTQKNQIKDYLSSLADFTEWEKEP